MNIFFVFIIAVVFGDSVVVVSGSGDHPLLPPHITTSAVRRGLVPHGYKGDRRHLHAALLRAIQDKHLRVGVVGGSVPLGHGLSSPGTESWPVVYQNYLSAHLSKLPDIMDVDVVNLAVPATSSYILSQFMDDEYWKRLSSCHVIVVDISVNDKYQSGKLIGPDGGYAAADGRQLMHSLLRHLGHNNANAPIGILYFETFAYFSLSSSPPIHSPSDIRSSFESSSFKSPKVDENSQRALLNHDGKKARRYDSKGKPIEFKSVPTKPSKKSPSVHPKISAAVVPSPCKCPFDVAQFIHWPAIVTYQVPVLSWPDVVCQTKTASSTNNLCDRFPHPTALYHEHMGKVVAFSTFELMIDALKEATNLTLTQQLAWRELDSGSLSQTSEYHSHEQEWESYTTESISKQRVADMLTNRDGIDDTDCEICERLTVMSAAFGNKFMPLSHGKAWIFGKDVEENEKYGWIANNKSLATKTYISDKESEILFRIVTRRNVLKVTVLKSYSSKMGTLYCCVDCPTFKRDHVINTRWNQKASMESAHLIKFANVTGPNNAPDDPTVERLVRCRASPGKKVKIISILSC